MVQLGAAALVDIVTVAPAMISALLLAPAVAVTHGMLRNSTPTAGSHQSTVPAELRLTFTEATELTVTRVELLGSDSQMVALGSRTHGAGNDRRVVVAAIRGALREGSHPVVWQMTAADGHAVRGRFTFTVMAGASGVGDATAAGAGAMQGVKTAVEAAAARSVDARPAAVPPRVHGRS